jgi:hypothetical protein
LQVHLERGAADAWAWAKWIGAPKNRA